jgi:hypothetical protein
LAHAADFNAYRNKLADHVDRAPAEKDSHKANGKRDYHGKG